MDSDDPEKRIRELERQLADPKGGPRENIAGPYEAPVVQTPGTMSPQPPSMTSPNYDVLRRQFNRRRRISSFWLIFVVPAILLVAVLVFHPYRVATHSAPSSSWSGAEPTPDPNGTVVGPGGNLTVSVFRDTVKVGCDHGELTIDGNTNVVTVTGHCGHLIIKGSDNKVTVDAADTIDTDGSGNQVVYKLGSPEFVNRGSGNSVRKG
jgi:Protein of unknown function (DUF3060)